MRVVLACLLVLLAVACGSKDPPPASPVEPSASAVVPASGSVAATAETVSPLAKRPLEVFNGCADVVAVLFGEDPKAASTAKRTIAPSATITDAPRANDGTQTVFLLDLNGTPLVKATVTKAMKRVEIGRSCRTIDAR